MRILLVENEETSVRTLHEELELAGIAAEVVVAGSRESALALLAHGEYDVVLCDLRIPPTDGALDEDEEHGLLVVRETRASHPVTRILILSGFSSLDNIGDIVNRPEMDIYGTLTPVPMIRDTPKKNYGLCVKELSAVASELDALATIKVECEPALPEADARALRVYARPRGGATVKVEALAPGLSDAAPLRIAVYGPNDQLQGSAFVKLGGRDAIASEELRFRLHVNGVLPAGSFPPVAEIVPTTGGRSALVYSLIAGPPKSLFVVLRDDEATAVDVVQRLRNLEATSWTAGAPMERTTVKNIRESRGGREDLIAVHLDGLDWQWLEAQELDVRRARQHGDLHGENVLVDGDRRPFVIDFAQTGPAVVSLDAVTLELSLAFHPSGTTGGAGWPSPEVLAAWPSVTGFAQSSPYPNFVAATRNWAESNGAGLRPVLANAYGHSVRQLAYRDVSPGLIRALVAGVIDEWRMETREAS